MPRPKNWEPRVLEPKWVKSRQKWRVKTLDPRAATRRGQETCRYFTQEQEALAFYETTRSQLLLLSGTTIGTALDAYDLHLADRGWRDKSRIELMRRLRLFFAPVKDNQVARLDGERAARLYRHVGEDKVVSGFVVGRRADYHRNALGNARGFLSWCVRKKWAAANALEGVQGVGKRSAGKAQLTGDEARRLYAWLLWKASRRTTETEIRDSNAATGVLMALLLALRSSDVTRRLVRDVDLDATVLRVSEGKTERSNRPRRLPPILQQLLGQQVRGRSSFEPLFPANEDGGHHTKAWLLSAMRRFCRDAEVPYVCPHSLKGTAGSVLAETGELADKIADHLSHEETSTTRRHYVAPGAFEAAQAERAAGLFGVRQAESALESVRGSANDAASARQS